jgi:exopolysaccharide biosynthesis polyprenyl glycosylphosphotransferase
VIGIGLVLPIFLQQGDPVGTDSLAVPVIGAWLVLALGVWVKLRFESNRQVRVAVIGTPSLADGLALELREAQIRGYQVVGWISDRKDDKGAPRKGDPALLGSLGEIAEVVCSNSIDLLVYGQSQPAEGSTEVPVSRLEVFEAVGTACLDLPVRMVEAPQLYEELLGHVPMGTINAAWFQYLMHPRYNPGSPASKRAMDLIVGSAAAIFAAPVIAVCAAAIKLTDGGAVFHRQVRLGEHGRPFEIVKLRTMREDAESGAPRWSGSDDHRVTVVGRILRRLHLDELPQAFQVLSGEMTLVGPRPERPELVTELERRLPYYQRRHLVKPGITGWAQVRCGYAGSELGTAWKLCHDLFYLKHRSMLTDMLIMVETLQAALGIEQYRQVAPSRKFILDEIDIEIAIKVAP